ncbi:MAG: acyl-CoA carboxylase subunit epsilon [Actinobacteria bacterium]|nr:acyl-CoA carboxylase subunit epsilon [Actinomycetota bacterium]
MSDAPVLRVISGEATEEDVAAILAAFAQIPAEETTADAWTARSPGLRTPLEHGPLAWRMSLR